MTQNVMRSEAERQFYLGMAGIRLWYAREPLPGAAPSPDFDFGAASADVPERAAPVAVPRVRQNAPSQALGDADKKDKLARLKTLMDTVPDKPAASVRRQNPLPVEVSAAISSPVAADEATVDEGPGQGTAYVDVLDQVPRVCLQSWSGSRIFLLANLSEDASLSLQETLARNIVRSLGESVTRESAVLRWPLFNNLKVSLNSETDLAGLMRDHLANATGKAVITLGLSSEMSVISDILDDVLEATPVVAFGHSLAALAADPDLKKQLWPLLKPLAVKTR
ncbi:MAG: hypothetical protein R6T87_09400 [Marinobacter sp.]